MNDDLGYEIIERVLSDGECDELLTILASKSVSRSRAGARHLLAIEAINSLANDARLTTVAARILGDTALPFRVTLFDKSSASNWSVVWHQDTALPLRTRIDAAEWGPWSRKRGVLYAHAPKEALARVVALRVHLDESSMSNGPLRVIPGTHRLGVLSDEQVAQAARERTSIDCIVGRGGIVAMRPLIIHSSPRIASSAPRRVLHIEYADAIEIQPGVVLAVA